MKRLIIEQSDDEFYTSHSGLALAGACINRHSDLGRQVGRLSRGGGQIADIDILRSYLGLLCLGKSDFQAITGMRDDDFFQQALGIGRVPSTERLRQRLDEAAADGLIPLVFRSSQSMLKQLGVPFEAEVVSAHRTPDRLFEYADTARDRGIQVIIAGAGGAAHLPGMCAAKTDLPVLGVPVKSSILNGVDSLLSIVQMPAGIAVGTLAIGPAGATNAAIMAAQILGLTRPEIAKNVAQFRAAQTDKVASNNIPGQV